jgi:hypothetical protein
VVTTGIINSIIEAPYLSLYPNPTANKVNIAIDLNENKGGNATIEILMVSGK